MAVLRCCFRAEGKDTTCGCCARRCLIVCSLLIIATAVKVYHDWGMWDSVEFTGYTGCSEMIYNFPASADGSDLYHDRKLMAKCHVSNSNDNPTHASIPLSARGHPIIHSKCGEVTSTQLSHRVPRHSNRTNPDFLVPNIVHYISLGARPFQFLNYLSFYSVNKFIKPEFIFVHGDALPYGDWWNRTLMQVPNIYFVRRDRPMRIQGKKVQWIEHSSDVIRLQTLLNNGGIYLDTDILVVKSFDDLRKFEVSLGRESSYGLGSGIILSQPNAPFTCMWFNTFRDYTPWPWHWAEYAVWTPNKLAKVIADHVHIEERSLQRPSWQETDLLFKKHYDWSNNYAVHVWHRYGAVPEEVAGINELDSTLGEIMRYIYYGSKVIRPSPK